MHIQLVVYVRLILATLVSITCIVGDNLLETTRHPLLKALCDNATHAIVGGLTGIAFIMHFYDKLSNVAGWTLIFACFAVSSFIDLDHFAAAKSLSLYAATNLSDRPFLHCTTIPLVLVFVFAAASMLQYFKTSLVLGIICCAFLTHHTRDAIRHGYWICPFGHTDRVPYSLYLIVTIVTPYALFLLHSFCRGNFALLNFTMAGKYYDRTTQNGAKMFIV